jgi:phosphate transport system ATP-binding protein
MPNSNTPLNAAVSQNTIPTLDEISIEVRSVDFFWGEKQVLHNVSLPVASCKVTALIGASGCGKSTLIRMFNRMNEQYGGGRHEGQVLVFGQDIYSNSIDVIELRRRVGMVFQKANPFPKSIADNILYGPRLTRRLTRQNEQEIIESCLLKASLWDEVKDRLKDNALRLSGGQQQRLCIARALAVNPDILLMDEPCSALDPISTAHIEELIEELKHSYTVVIVTHNMQQARRVSDYTAFLHMGRLAEFDLTTTVFESPHSQLTRDYVSGRFG